MPKARLTMTYIEQVRTARVMGDAHGAVWRIMVRLFVFPKVCLSTCIARRVLWNDTTI
jgi:hypothetical protein